MLNCYNKNKALKVSISMKFISTSKKNRMIIFHLKRFKKMISQLIQLTIKLTILIINDFVTVNNFKMFAFFKFWFSFFIRISYSIHSDIICNYCSLRLPFFY